MSNGGFVVLHRSLHDHWIAGDAVAAWLFAMLIMRANWKDGIANLPRQKGIKILRGQVVTGDQQLAEKINVCRGTVRRKLFLLEKGGMITVKRYTTGSVITICNYDEYQSIKNEHGTTSSTTSSTHQNQENQENQENTDNQLLLCSEQKSPVQINDPKPKPKKAAAPTGGSEVWSAYSTAYQERYKVEPVRNAKTNKNCSDLVNRLGKDVAVKVVRFYLTHGHSYYLQKTHAIGLCLQDAESLHTQMLRDSRVTSSQAQQSDKGSEQADIFDRVTKRLEQKYGSKET